MSIKVFDKNHDTLHYSFIYNAEETNKINDVFSGLRKEETLSINDLRRVALWKINRVLDISDELIAKLDHLAKDPSVDIHDESTQEIIISLTSSRGIGFPLASTILKFLRPDIFPIIDVRAYRALFGKKLSSSQYSLAVYYEYIKEIYHLRDTLGLPLETIDQQLYEFDKEKNGRI